MIVLGLDPGYRRSALVVFDGAQVLSHDILPNEELLVNLPNHLGRGKEWAGSVLVVEAMQLFKSNYGVGQEVFDSVFWSGRFVQAWFPGKFDRLLRVKVRSHLRCHKGGDAAVRAALIERFGPYKEEAIGKKATPGPLFGIKADEWQALAIAVTYYDIQGQQPEQIRPGVTGEF